MTKFTIDGVAYESDLIDGPQQIHVMKRLLPAFTALAGVASSLRPAEAEDGVTPPAESGTERLATILMPVTKELAALPDADVDFILNACLDVTRRQVANGVGWVKVRQNGVVQDKGDNKFATRLAIAWNVIGENFADMFASFGIDLQGLMAGAGGKV